MVTTAYPLMPASLQVFAVSVSVGHMFSSRICATLSVYMSSACNLRIFCPQGQGMQELSQLGAIPGLPTPQEAVKWSELQCI